MKFCDLQAQYQLIHEQIKQRIDTVLTHGQFIMGPEIQELEHKLQEFTDVKNCIAVSSGTDALLIALMALDISPGDEVITTAFSFFATAETIAFVGAIPVLVDIDPKTYNLDARKLEQFITDKTKAIVAVDLYGQPANYKDINAIAEKYQLPVIEDAAQSLGASYYGRQACGLTTIGCTSFFPSKPLGGYGDSGACFTNDDALADAMRQIRVHGQSQRYFHTRLGLNGRMDTLQAAILLSKLELFQSEITLRQSVARNYNEQLENNIIKPVILENTSSSFAQYTIQVSDRERVIRELKQENIPTAVHYPRGLHQQPALSCKHDSLAVTDRVSQRVLSLPMHPYLSESEIDRVCEQVNRINRNIQHEYTENEVVV